MADQLILKWGTLKGWDVESDAFRSALQRYADIGEHSMGAATQHDTPEQKAALCGAIDACDGEIINDWTGKVMTKDEAKKYVLEYGS